jgi:bile-acid 7alpha-dehydratase
MDGVERLVAIEEIKQVKGRYQRALDEGRWADFEDCLTEDFSVFEDGLDERIHGRANVLAAVRMGFDLFQEQGGWKHWVILPEIEITTETTATGRWTFAVPGLEGNAWYEDRYEKVDGRWRIQWTHVHLGRPPAVADLDEAKARLAEALADAELT